MFSGADPALVDPVRIFGERVGVAFQLADDVIDIVSDGASSGKTRGTDLREGVPTLPIIYVLEGTDPGEARLREVLLERAEEPAPSPAVLVVRASG